MGIFNYQGDFKLTRCIACNGDQINTNVGEHGRNSYDYICNSSCKKTIIISDLVLSSTFIQDIKKDNTKRNELHQDIVNYKHDEYQITSDVASFFNGDTYREHLPTKSFELWQSGKMPGYPNKYEHISKEELIRINEEQKKIFKSKVEKHLEEFIERFKKKIEESADPSALIELEIKGIKNLLSDSQLNRHENDFGTFYFDSTFASKIRKQYRNLIQGTADYNCIIHPKIDKLIGSQWQSEYAIVDASVFPKYINYLEGLTSSEEDETQEDLNSKIDEILKKVIRLEHGQEIIFDEVNSLKEYSKKLPKREFRQMVLGKLFELGGKKLVDSEFAKDVMKTLFGDDFNKLLGNL